MIRLQTFLGQYVFFSSKKDNLEAFPPIAYFFICNTVFFVLVKFLGMEKDKELFNQVYQKLTISSNQFAKDIHTGIPFYHSANKYSLCE